MRTYYSNKTPYMYVSYMESQPQSQTLALVRAHYQQTAEKNIMQRGASMEFIRRHAVWGSLS